MFIQTCMETGKEINYLKSHTFDKRMIKELINTIG